MARRPIGDSRSQAEAAFKTATTKPLEQPAPPAPSVPGAKETVSLRIDRDVLDFFQAEGPRLLKSYAVWAGEEDRILFYDCTGQRFSELRLSDAPDPRVALSA